MVERRLGRGLDFLISGGLGSSDGDDILRIEVQDLRPNPFQPRHDFAEDELAELTASIREHGVLQPVIARRTAAGYELIAGERRWRACQRLGLATVPAVLRQADDTQMLEIALVENLQREDLNPIEVARGYATYIERLGLTQQEAAERMGKSRPAVANALRLLELPRDIQELVSRGTISAGHARAMLALPDAETQRRMAQRVVDQGLSVRDVEGAVRPGAKTRGAPSAEASPYQVDLEERLTRILGTRVKLRTRKGGRGSIVIDYFSSEDLDRLLGLLMTD